MPPHRIPGGCAVDADADRLRPRSTELTGGGCATDGARSHRSGRRMKTGCPRPRDPIGTITEPQVASASDLKPRLWRFGIRRQNYDRPPHSSTTRHQGHQARHGRSSPVAVERTGARGGVARQSRPAPRRAAGDVPMVGGRTRGSAGVFRQARGEEPQEASANGLGRQRTIAGQFFLRTALAVGRDVLAVAAVAGVAELARSVARQVNQHRLAIRCRADLESAQLTRSDQVGQRHRHLGAHPLPQRVMN